MFKGAKGKTVAFIITIVILSAGCYAGAEFLLPDNVQPSTTTEISETNTTESCSLTEKITEILTLPVTTKPVTTEKITAASTTRIYQETKPTQAVTFPDVTALDYGCFENCAFIGNSRILALKTYGMIKNVYGSVGLTVDTVFTESVSGHNIPVIDELNGKSFDKIFILFGDNECGWPNPDIFIERYTKVINAVRERVPGAEIYLQSVLPVSRHAEETTKFGCTNSRINLINDKIKALAEAENVYFVEPSNALKGPDGTLPEEAASDGIHLNKKYCKIWLNYLVENITF